MFSQGSAEKRGVGAQQAEDENPFLKASAEETESIADTIMNCLLEVETREGRLEERIEKLERKMGSVPGCASGSFRGFQFQIISNS